VYLQNQVLKPDGKLTLNTRCRGPVRFELIPIHQRGGIDFEKVFAGLASIAYRGPLTVHQAGGERATTRAAAERAAAYLRELAAQSGLESR
jgi:sugar phosphate isomerase/epimerase